MKNMRLPHCILSLYLELFLFWFVTQHSHEWLWNVMESSEEKIQNLGRNGRANESQISQNITIERYEFVRITGIIGNVMFIGFR